MKVVYNVSEEEAQEIKEKIKENGGHCLCAIQKSMDTKCMCKDFRDKTENGYFGECGCGLYKSIPTIVYLCGDTARYYQDFIRWHGYFSQEGMIVLMPGQFSLTHPDSHEASTNIANTNEQKLHFSDVIFVIDKYGNVDEDMNKTIQFAKKNGKKIMYASEMDD